MAQLELNGHGSVCMWVKSLSRAGTVGAGAHALLLNERERTVPYRTVPFGGIKLLLSNRVAAELLLGLMVMLNILLLYSPYVV